VDDLNTTSEVLDVTSARGRLEDARPVVEAIMGLSREMASLHSELRTGRVDEDREAALRDRHDRAQNVLLEKIRDLNAMGAVLKDPMTGLIDFYTWHDGELVFLCWRHGEETINYWHGLEDGFQGRRPVSELES